jgi:hypothetical protein
MQRPKNDDYTSPKITSDTGIPDTGIPDTGIPDTDLGGLVMRGSLGWVDRPCISARTGDFGIVDGLHRVGL